MKSKTAPPAEIEAAALAWKPDWPPEMNEIPHARDPEQESSLCASNTFQPQRRFFSKPA